MRRKALIPLVLACLVTLQAISSSVARHNGFLMSQDYDEDFSKWPADSLKQYVDSVLAMSMEEDSIETTLILGDVPDSLQHTLDSAWRAIYLRDSTEKARIAFQRWFDSLSKKEQKKWTVENVIIPAQIHKADSIQEVKDSIRAYRDSVRECTPRILETPFIPDSLWYKRILVMQRDMKFGDIKQQKKDTSYNYYYYDYPFFHQDVNATWVGVSGSPVQLQNVFRQVEEENAIFFTPFQSWGFTPSTVPMFNTKTPYTELGYTGTLLSGDAKEELNAHFLTSQNITPALNVTFNVDKFSGKGHLTKGDTEGYNMFLTTNYLGKRYSIHGGWLHNKITRTENGGIQDDMWIKDTTVQAKEIPVNLSEAKNVTIKNTLFLNHHLRIPFGSDSLTTAYVGHSLDLSLYQKKYTDKITDAVGKEFYHNVFNINPTSSDDLMELTKFDNKFYLRLQPWKDQSVVSKIDVGIGDKLLVYTDINPVRDTSGTITGTSKGTYTENDIYAYAGVKGSVKKYFNWAADGRIYFAGYEAGDFDVNANMNVNFYPFRRHRNSPLTVGALFHMDLTQPDHYEQRLFLNHFSWDNDFDRKSTMKVGGFVDIPSWKLYADVGYSLLGGSIYYDNDMIIRQSKEPVNVISANLRKDFRLWMFYFENNLLLQFSSDQKVKPVPLLSMNLRWYFQFNVVRNVMQMQLGASCLYMTSWKMPGWNPNVGVFYNQTEYEYGNCPYIDVFLNIQWKRACIFIKGENINQGKDYFTAAHYIHTQRTVKMGIMWPFYIQPKKSGHTHDHGHGHTN